MSHTIDVFLIFFNGSLSKELNVIVKPIKHVFDCPKTCHYTSHVSKLSFSEHQKAGINILTE